MRSYEALARYAEYEDAKCAEYEKYTEYVKNCKICIIKDLFSVQNQVPGLASSLPGKYGQHNFLILILRFRHCPLPLAFFCCGAAFLEIVLHWQLHRHNRFYASSSPSESDPLDEGWSVGAAGGSLRWKRGGRAGG